MQTADGSSSSCSRPKRKCASKTPGFYNCQSTGPIENIQRAHGRYKKWNQLTTIYFTDIVETIATFTTVEIGGVHYQIHYYLSEDYKFLLTVCGMRAANSKHPYIILFSWQWKLAFIQTLCAGTRIREVHTYFASRMRCAKFELLLQQAGVRGAPLSYDKEAKFVTCRDLRGPEKRKVENVLDDTERLVEEHTHGKAVVLAWKEFCRIHHEMCTYRRDEADSSTRASEIDHLCQDIRKWLEDLVKECTKKIVMPYMHLFVVRAVEIIEKHGYIIQCTGPRKIERHDNKWVLPWNKSPEGCTLNQTDHA